MHYDLNTVLFVEPTGGLCNRFRVIVSSYLAAEKNKKKLIVIWRNTPNCNCTASDLFTLPKDISIFSIKNIIANKAINFFTKIFFDTVYTDQEVIDHIQNSSIDNILKKTGPIYIQTCVSLYGQQHAKEYDYSIIKPQPDILAEIPSVFNEKHITGIHIRRTDNIKSIEFSPVELFFEKMDLEMEKDKGNHYFFIATDEENIKTLMTVRYGKEHILTRNGIDLSRSSSNGIRDAYIDLLCLSRCDKIYGSYSSSFSKCASSIGKIPIIICKKE